MIQFDEHIFSIRVGSSNRLDSHLGSNKGSGRKHKGWEPDNWPVERQDMEARLAAFEKRSWVTDFAQSVQGQAVISAR